MTEQVDSWTTTGGKKWYVGTTLEKRARKRVVERIDEGHWIVDGDGKLGDAYPSYGVTRGNGTKKYECSCYSHGKGEIRRKKMCSHVLAVVIHNAENEWVGKKKPLPDTEPKDLNVTISISAVDDEPGGYAARGDGARRGQAARQGGAKAQRRPKGWKKGKGGNAATEPERIPESAGINATHLPDDAIDTDDPMLGTPTLPVKFTEYRDNQWDAIVEIMEHFDDGKKVVMLSAPTGCLAGDTMVGVNRGGKGFQIRIGDLVHRFNGGEIALGKGRTRTTTWDQSIPTKVQRAADGVMRLATIRNAWVSGKKETYRLTTENGRQIEATLTHPFLLDGDNLDDWVQLGQLRRGDGIRVLDGQGKATHKPKSWYRLVNGLKHHPHAARRGVRPDKGGWSIVQHRLVVEADMNGVGYDEWVQAHKTGRVNLSWVYLDPGVFAVHHLDHDPRNNERSNLQVITHREHARAHGQDNGKNVAYQIGVDVVKSIERVGFQQTYDIEVEDSPHNFIANGFVVHNSGKTLIGETVRRLMAGQSTYCCTTKTLQDQIQREFEYARTIKGRSNYPTEFRRDLTAEDCTGTSANSYECDWCSERTTCPYWLAKEDATYSPLPILNIAYFLSETTSRLTSAFRGRELVIIDEADTLEEQLMSSIEVVIGSQLRKSIGVKTLPKKTVPNDWVRWLEDEVVPKIKYRQSQIRSEMRTLYGESTQKRRQVKRLENLVRKIQPLLVSSDSGARIIEDGWVMTGYEGKGKDPTIRFKPVRVDEHARNALWERGGQFLLMSATLISPTQMADDLGLSRDEWEVVHLDSTFPIENRPIFVNDVTPVTNKTKATAYPKLAKAIDEILDENPGVRVLIHTVSYLLTKYLMEHVDSTRTMTYGSSGERERVLREFLAVDDAVLLAPSFERGIDLPEEDCQIIVIAKVPYPYLGDKQIAARMYGKGGRVWYCTSPETKVLRGDLVWVEAQHIHEGDTLFGFDENGPYRRWKPTKVEAVGPVRQPTYKMNMGDGTTLTSSAGHKWLALVDGDPDKGNKRKYVWMTTEEIAAPSPYREHPIRLVRLLDVWKYEQDWTTGYLAGIFDGEGTLNQSYPNGGTSHCLRVSYSQNPGSVADLTLDVAKVLGFTFLKHGRKGAKDNADAYTVKGGKSEALRFLGQVRPVRLLNNFDIEKLDGHLNKKELVSVESVEFIGEQDLIGIQTSTRTFIAEGFASHNSVQTIRSIVQMTGRGMRSKDDWCDVVILDTQFKRLYRDNKRLFPNWWRESLVVSMTDPKYRILIEAARERREGRNRT